MATASPVSRSTSAPSAPFNVENVESVEFTAEQRTVLDALTAGVSRIDAAKTANVHRSTINNWEKAVPGYAAAVAAAKEEYRAGLSSQLRRVSGKAVNALETLIDDPSTPPSVRLRAIHLTLTRPRFPDKGWALPEAIESPEVQKLQQQFDYFEAEYRANLHDEQLLREQAKTDRIRRGEAEETQKSVETVENVECQHLPLPPDILDNPDKADTTKAQSSSPHQIGRNAPCPCGSGQKHKRCCGKSAPPVLGVTRSAA